MQRHCFRRSAVKGSIIYGEEPTIPGPETEPGPFDPTGKISAQKEVRSTVFFSFFFFGASETTQVLSLSCLYLNLLQLHPPYPHP